MTPGATLLLLLRAAPPAPAGVFGAGWLAAASRRRRAAVVPPRDDRVLLAARALLDATGQFSRVECGHGPEDWDFSAEDRAYALLWIEDQDEIDDGMSGVEADIVHSAVYMLRIAVRDEGPAARLERLQRLGSVAKNALDGVSIGGITFPGFTKLRLARREAGARHPDSWRTHRGEWRYLVAGFGGHDEGDLEDR